MYNHIMLAVDGSENSMRAAEHCVRFASLMQGCTVEVVYVADYAKAKTDVLHAGFGTELQQVRRKRLEPVEQLLIEHKLSYNIHILHGEAAPTVVEFANNQKIDLVIIGSRGLNSLQEMVLGSVSHKVVKRANCPVLVIK